MILADIQSDINLVLGFFGFFFGFALAIAFLVARLVLRRGQQEYKEAGGHKQLAKNAAKKGAAALLKKFIKRRFS